MEHRSLLIFYIYFIIEFCVYYIIAIQIEANYITGKLTNDSSAIFTEIIGHTPKICCEYSVKGIENAISEAYPELQAKSGITHLRFAKPYLSVELFTYNLPLVIVK